MNRYLVHIGFILVGLVSCGRAELGSMPGTEGGPCYGNRTCNAGLSCSVSGLCVVPGGTCLGAACDPSQHPDMVLIQDFPGGAFLIDMYEASAGADGDWGDEEQDRDGDGKIADPRAATAHAESFGFRFDDDGGEEGVTLTTKVALSRPGEYPAGVSFYQAMGACANAGKRLCTRAEWTWACQGGWAFNVFPYGSIFDGADEQGRDCWTLSLADRVQPTGTAAACRTPTGIYDMSGNMSEWTEYAAPEEAYLSGGTYDVGSWGNATCEATMWSEPDNAANFWGFRCCVSQ